MSETLVFDTLQDLWTILGVNDRNVPYLETLLGCEILVKGNVLSILGDTPLAKPLFQRLLALASSKSEEFTQSEIFMEYQLIDEPLLSSLTEKGSVIDHEIKVGGKAIWPKSNAQKEFINALFTDQIVFGVGPAGTGKTFIAIMYALMLLLSGVKRKIVLTRPVVEAGESLGFLPGDLSQKLNPYLKPLYDAMEYVLPPSEVKRLEESGAIEIAPLAYMRGRSISHAVIVLDEAQNTTKGQMQMFLTRIGEDSQAVVTGDITQIDLPSYRESGLVDALSVLHDIYGLSMVRFTHKDVVRSRIVRAIINAYENGQRGERSAD